MANVRDPAALRALREVQDELLAKLDPEKTIRRVLREAVALLPAAQGASIGLPAPDGGIEIVAATGLLQETVGSPMSAGSLAATAISLGAVLRSNDARTDPRVRRAEWENTGLRSLVCVPLLGGSGGALIVASAHAAAFDDDSVQVLQSLADFMSSSLAAAENVYRSARQALSLPSGSELPGVVDVPRLSKLTGFVANSLGLDIQSYREMVEARHRIRRMLSRGGPSIVLQPIFDLREERPVGYEALARFHTNPKRPPDVWFKEASSVGMGLELEAASLRSALNVLEQLPNDAYLSINLSPQGATTGSVVDLLAKAPPHRLVIEVTEHTVVNDYDELNESLKTARERGTRIAVDDAGAGYASMRHILKLKPDCIKLDIGLTNGIDQDPVRRALASSLISFAGEIDATIVAEGIETKAEVHALRDLGVGYGQGYYLGRPAPLRRARPRRLPARHVEAETSRI